MRGAKLSGGGVWGIGRAEHSKRYLNPVFGVD